MAMTPYLHFTTFPSLSSPLLFCKPHHPPFSQPPYLSTLQFNRYTFLSVSSRQNQKPFAVNFSSQIVNAESSSSSNTREPMRPPYNVLITGSTKGIGYALAKEFLQTGDNVIICSRSAERVESAVKSLREEFGEQHVVLNVMLEKDWTFAAYGATKRSVVHLTKSLQAELQMQDVKNVVVHNLSPGMVTTDLLMSGATTKQAKFFINVLAEPAEVVAKSLVPNIRSVPASGSMKPTYIRFLTGIKAYSQIFSRFAFGARRNRYMPED
nr:chlorophyll(ide) b reductase nol, chloroplastic [Quercus suber]